MRAFFLTIFVTAGAVAFAVGASEPRRVEAAATPKGPWREYPTRTLDDLPATVTARTDGALCPYGGWTAHTAKATGFFRPEKIGDRWWLVDPDGHLFLHVGVCSVTMLRTPGAEKALADRFGSDTNWAAATVSLLRGHGFNGLGAWSDTARLRAAPPRPLVYTAMWNFMSSYGRKRGGTYQKPGHTGYPSDCIFVFDPGFEAFCDEHARPLAAVRDDPWLLGHFSDNEMPLRREALKNYLSLPPSDPGHQAAAGFLRQRHGAGATAGDMAAGDEEDFLALVVDRYFRTVSKAIRKYDPNHLYLGSRFHGSDLARPEIFRASGPYLDVVAVNYYRAWTPDRERLAMWTRESGKPVIITEWYAKGMDSGMGNLTGAGWTVKTQRDRGLFYENFTLGLLESKTCVGWHWFKYGDNDPEDKRADPSNLDSNKGLVSNRYEPWRPLLDSMRRINTRVYGLAAHFDGKATPE